MSKVRGMYGEEYKGTTGMECFLFQTQVNRINISLIFVR